MDKITKPPVLRQIGDYLDLEVEGIYISSDGSETWTISVDNLLEAQRDDTYEKTLKTVIEWGNEECPHSYLLKIKQRCRFCWEALTKAGGGMMDKQKLREQIAKLLVSYEFCCPLEEVESEAWEMATQQERDSFLAKADRILSLNTVDECPECMGEGRRPLSMGGMIHDCPTCKGTGEKPPVKLNLLTPEEIKTAHDNAITKTPFPISDDWVEMVQQVRTLQDQINKEIEQPLIDKIKRENPDHTFEEG